MADLLTCRLLRLIDCLSMLYEILVGEGPWERTTVILKKVPNGLQESFLKNNILKNIDIPLCGGNGYCNVLLTSNRMVSEGAYYDAVQTALLYRSNCCEEDGKRRTDKVCNGLWELLILRIYRALTVWGKVSPINFDDFKDFIEKYVCSYPEFSNINVGRDETWRFKVLHFLWPDTYPAVDDKIANNLLKNIATELGYNPDRVKKLDALLILVEIIRKLKDSVEDMGSDRGCSDSLNSYLISVDTPKTFAKKFEQALWTAAWLRSQGSSQEINFVDDKFIKSFMDSRCGVCTQDSSCGPSVYAETLYHSLVGCLAKFISNDNRLRRLADEAFQGSR